MIFHVCGPDMAETVLRLTHAAFATLALARPSGALAETVDDVLAAITSPETGVLAVLDDGVAVGCLRWRVEDDHLYVGRVSVDPARHGRGVGEFLMAGAHTIARAHDRDEIRLGVRHGLDRQRRWYERLGYRFVFAHDDWDLLARSVEPLALARPAVMDKLDWPDTPYARFTVDVLDDRPEGTWVRIPQFSHCVDGDGRFVWVAHEELVGYLPSSDWWTAWWWRDSGTVKVDVTTPTERHADGRLSWVDLFLDVIYRPGEGAELVDEDELAAAEVRARDPLPAEVAAKARSVAAEVLAALRAF